MPARLLYDYSLLDHALILASGESPLVAISVRDTALNVRGVPLLPDLTGKGPIAGIAAALAFARSNGVKRVLTIPCDTPFSAI